MEIDEMLEMTEKSRSFYEFEKKKRSESYTGFLIGNYVEKMDEIWR